METQGREDAQSSLTVCAWDWRKGRGEEFNHELLLCNLTIKARGFEELELLRQSHK